MMSRLIATIAAMTLGCLVAACTEEGGKIAAKTAPQIVGEWKSESVTRQGTITAKFSEDGTCYLRESGGAQQPCTWTGPGSGQTKIAINFPGKSEASPASLDGDRLSIHEPGRDTLFIRNASYKFLESLRPLLFGDAAK